MQHGAWILLLSLYALPSDPIDVESLPLEQRTNYQVFALRCSKCHPLSRPLGARLTDSEWKTYVEKMARRPGSGINKTAGAQILAFLSYRNREGAADAGTGGPMGRAE